MTPREARDKKCPFRQGAFSECVADRCMAWAIVPMDAGPAKPVFSLPVDDLDLSARASNVLRNDGINTIGALCAMTERGILRLPNCGRNTLKELVDKLAARGLRLGLETTPYVEHGRCRLI